MRTQFICAVKSEAILKALFKVKDDDLTSQRAVELEQEIEEAAKVAKETVHEPRTSSVTTVLKMKDNKKTCTKPKQYSVGQKQKHNPILPKGACFRCGKTNLCRFITSTCQKKGHLESVCLTKKRSQGSLCTFWRKDTFQWNL